MAVAHESESNSPCSVQAECGQALCNLLQMVSALNSQELGQERVAGDRGLGGEKWVVPASGSYRGKGFGGRHR